MFCGLKNSLVWSALSTTPQHRLHAEQLLYDHLMHTDRDARSRVAHLVYLLQDSQKYAPGCMEKYISLWPDLQKKLSNFLDVIGSTDTAKLEEAIVDLSSLFSDEILPWDSLHTLKQAVEGDSGLLDALRKICPYNRTDELSIDCLNRLKRSLTSLNAPGLIIMAESAIRQPVYKECVQALVDMLCEWFGLSESCEGHSDNGCWVIDQSLHLSGLSLLEILAKVYPNYYREEGVMKGILALIGLPHDNIHYQVIVSSVLKTCVQLRENALLDLSAEMKAEMESAVKTLINSDISSISELAIKYTALVNPESISQLLHTELQIKPSTPQHHNTDDNDDDDDVDPKVTAVSTVDGGSVGPGSGFEAELSSLGNHPSCLKPGMNPSQHPQINPSTPQHHNTDNDDDDNDDDDDVDPKITEGSTADGGSVGPGRGFEAEPSSLGSRKRSAEHDRPIYHESPALNTTALSLDVDSIEKARGTDSFTSPPAKLPRLQPSSESLSRQSTRNTTSCLISFSDDDENDISESVHDRDSQAHQEATEASAPIRDTLLAPESVMHTYTIGSGTARCNIEISSISSNHISITVTHQTVTGSASQVLLNNADNNMILEITVTK